MANVPRTPGPWTPPSFVSLPAVPVGQFYGDAALTGTGSMTVAGVVTRLGIAALGGSGSLSAAGVRTRLGAGSLSGSGSTVVSGVVTRYGTASLSGSGAMTVAGVVTRFGVVALSGTGSLSATGLHIAYAAGSLTGTGSLSATGIVGDLGVATLTGTGTLSATAMVTRFARADLSGEGFLSVLADVIAGPPPTTDFTFGSGILGIFPPGTEVSVYLPSQEPGEAGQLIETRMIEDPLMFTGLLVGQQYRLVGQVTRQVRERGRLRTRTARRECSFLS